MCKIGIAVLVSVLVGLLLLVALPVSAEMQGWQYQREITIQENSGETLRDYQVLVELGGSDFPEEAQADGDDIRFINADRRELSHWIEKFDTGAKRARIWVKMPETPANGEKIITMWYGNPGAVGTSDGEAVFEFFDDFSGNAFGSKWTTVDAQWSVNKNGLAFHNNVIATTWDALASSQGVVNGWTEAKVKVMNVPTFVRADNPHQEIALFIRSDKLGRYIDTNTLQLILRFDNQNLACWSEWASASFVPFSCSYDRWYRLAIFHSGSTIKYYIDDVEKYSTTTAHTTENHVGFRGITAASYVDWIYTRKHTSPEPTITITPPSSATHTALSITKSPSPHSIRQFGETAITLSIENSGTTDATDIEITDAIHPSFDLTSGDFPNPKRYDLIRPGETRDLQYTISAKESGTFTLDYATVTYADEDGNIQEVKSEPVSIKVIPSTDGDTVGTSHNPSVSTASVQLHGEKTDVVLGEDILLKLSAVNLITKPTMHVQVIIIPPSGMSVTSSAFAKSGAGQYTTTYELESGTGKDIEVAIRSNQVGDFEVNGRIIYYFGDDRDDAEDHILTLPIAVRAEAKNGQVTGTSESEGSSTPGFAAVVAIIGLLLAYLRKRA